LGEAAILLKETTSPGLALYFFSASNIGSDGIQTVFPGGDRTSSYVVLFTAHALSPVRYIFQNTLFDPGNGSWELP
jgi:hypothetical protein